MDRKKLSMIAAICGGLVFLGMILPIASVSFLGQSKSFNGFDGDTWGGGVIALILSVAAGAAALLVFLDKTDAVPLDGRQLLFLGVGAFGLSALLVLIQFFSGDYKTAEVSGITMGASRGIGLYLMVLATLGGAAACFLATKHAPSSGGGDGDEPS